MEKRIMKAGEIFTEKRVVNGGTGYYFAPVRLVNVALVGMEKTAFDNIPGSPAVQTFVFRCMQAGDAEIQLARLCADKADVMYEEVLPITVEPTLEANDEVILGGWSPFAEPTDADRQVFEKVQTGLKGVDYTLLKVSRQIVNGTNYRFACTGRLVIAAPDTFPAIIKAQVGTDGELANVRVERVLL